jgi:hypothetical protein
MKKVFRMDFGFPDPWENEPVWGERFGGILSLCVIAVWLLCTFSVAHAYQQEGMAPPVIEMAIRF